MESAGKQPTVTVISTPPGALPIRLKALRWLGRQTWIPRGQDRVLRWLWNPDSGRSFPFEVDFFGQRYPGDLSRFLDWVVFAYGAQAYSELTLLEALLGELRKTRDRVVFYDVGANMGHHTLFMADKVDAVIAFEPYLPLQHLIRQKIDLNGLENVRIVPVALGDADEVRLYYPGSTVNSGTGTFVPDNEESRREPVPLKIRRGDRICGELDLPNIDLLKVDVEGFEPLVFRGLAERIRRDRPAILTEFTAPSWACYESERDLRQNFWEGAVFAHVSGRNGCRFKLRPFVFGKSDEVLIVPPELEHFVGSHMEG